MSAAQQGLQFFQHATGSVPVYFCRQPTSTNVDNQAFRIERMQAAKKSQDFLVANMKRLEKSTPDHIAVAQKKGISRPGYYKITGKKGSPTLRTLDKISEVFGAPAWLLLHPEMKAWDSQRDWIEHIIRAYLSADPDGKELIRRTIVQIEKTAVTA